MRKMIKIASILAVLFANNVAFTNVAKAGYWQSTPNYGGGYTYRYYKDACNYYKCW